MSLSERIRPGVEVAPWVIDEIKALEQERDALRAKVAEMERQEPAALVKWQVGGLVVHIIGDAKAGDILYALPGAKGEEK